MTELWILYIVTTLQFSLNISILISTRLLNVRFSLGKYRYNSSMILYINDDSICIFYLNLKHCSCVWHKLIKKYLVHILLIFRVCQQHKLNLSAMFTGIDRFYFEQPVRILVLILNWKRGSSLYLKQQSRDKYVFAVIIKYSCLQ